MNEKFIKPPQHWKFEGEMEWPPRSGNMASKAWTHKLVTGFNVLRSKSTMNDGSEWVHVSVSLPDRLPTWAEIAKVKLEFIGGPQYAYHIVPAELDHVNVHNYCMHIWSPLDEKHVLPKLTDLKWESSK